VTRLRADARFEVLARLVPGDYFGETALLANVRRTANVTARTNARLLALRAGHFRRWIAGRPEIGESLRRSIATRDRLLTLPLLRGLSASEIDRLADRFLITRYLPDDTIIRQGDEGDRFYIIVDGKVDVIREATGATMLLATLGPGEVFGEMALLSNAPRSATVRALTSVETYTLSAADFHDLVRYRSVSASLQSIAARRTGSTFATPRPG
jgi:CRP-like cAMP-binding protein